jgi:hypothetical protein
MCPNQAQNHMKASNSWSIFAKRIFNRIFNLKLLIMRKKILSFAALAGIALVAGWNVSQSMNEVALSDIALENVEALADEANGLPNVCCPIWDVSITYPGSPLSFPAVTCTTGGLYKCKDCICS